MKIKSFSLFVLGILLAPMMLGQSVVYTKSKHVSLAVLAVNKQQIVLSHQQFKLFNDSQSQILVDVDFYSEQGLKSKR